MMFVASGTVFSKRHSGCLVVALYGWHYRPVDSLASTVLHATSTLHGLGAEIQPQFSTVHR